jgi:probable F420-dependent oxidoreductase
MNHWTTYPLISHPYNPEFVTGDALVQFAQAAEQAGFSGIAFTDHPAPSNKWLTAGGHDALDPFAALSFVASATKRLRLIPNIVVLPYRNPFIVAKAAATIDVLSGGRFVLSVAAGYLRSEYRALGVDFERRNELFDDALEVLRGVWTTDSYSYEADGFVAKEVTANPKPKHIPIWIGGNTRRARLRVARHGDGWNPFPAPPALAQTARTKVLENLDDLAPMIQELRHLTEDEGRDPAAIDVAFTTGKPGPDRATFRPADHLEALEQITDIGVTWNAIGVPGESLDSAIAALRQYGDTVIEPFSKDG